MNIIKEKAKFQIQNLNVSVEIQFSGQNFEFKFSDIKFIVNIFFFIERLSVIAKRR